MLNETQNGLFGSVAFDETQLDQKFVAALISDYQDALMCVIDNPEQTFGKLAAGIGRHGSPASTITAAQSQTTSV